jgi:hypothetical protein
VFVDKHRMIDKVQKHNICAFEFVLSNLIKTPPKMVPCPGAKGGGRGEHLVKNRGFS